MPTLTHQDPIHRVQAAMSLVLTRRSAWQGQADLLRLRGGLQAEWLRMTRGSAEPPDQAAPFIAALGPGWSPDITLICLQVGAALLLAAPAHPERTRLAIQLKPAERVPPTEIAHWPLRLAYSMGDGHTITVQATRLFDGRTAEVLIK